MPRERNDVAVGNQCRERRRHGTLSDPPQLSQCLLCLRIGGRRDAPLGELRESPRIEVVRQLLPVALLQRDTQRINADGADHGHERFGCHGRKTYVWAHTIVERLEDASQIAAIEFDEHFCCLHRCVLARLGPIDENSLVHKCKHSP